MNETASLGPLATVPRKQCSGLRKNGPGVDNANKKSFVFHDSTSVLPPVIRHAVHPAVLHHLLMARDCIGAGAVRRMGGVEREGISGFAVNVMQALHQLRHPHPPINTRGN